mmetsp:Transcript_17749/g.50545  ORF Transcript_17749/g.50545 Transcript_17749/m.50545 type:complete len:96 (-) Transcript_17749:2-289(-)
MFAAMPHAATASAVDTELSASPSAPGGKARCAVAVRTPVLEAGARTPAKAEPQPQNRAVTASARRAKGSRAPRPAMVLLLRRSGGAGDWERGLRT